jgi:hypothetical protein
LQERGLSMQGCHLAPETMLHIITIVLVFVLVVVSRWFTWRVKKVWSTKVALWLLLLTFIIKSVDVLLHGENEKYGICQAICLMGFVLFFMIGNQRPTPSAPPPAPRSPALSRGHSVGGDRGAI